MTDRDPITGEVELCRVYDCDRAAQVIIDVALTWMDKEGVEDLGTQPIAVCRHHQDIE